jgi:hypothetical protein
MGLVAAGGLLAAPGVSVAAAADLFYERTVMTAADARCGLFAPPVGAALAAGRMQAHGAAIRSGADKAELARLEQRARAKAASTPCASADMTLAAGRVREAFEGYAQLSRMTYPGELAEWRADRSGGVRWRLQQSASFGWNKMTFGLAGREGANALMAVANFADGKAPYGARLVLRDTDATLGPYLDTRGQPLSKLPLARRLPPPTARNAYSAEARSAAGLDLLPKGYKSGWAFRFPAAAAHALAELDPREAVAVEFLFAGPDGEVVRRAYVEVGDFAAGRAFLQVATR